jgi:hypothetical protein
LTIAEGIVLNCLEIIEWGGRMGKQSKSKLLGFEKAVFSKDQLEFVAWQSQHLQAWV